MLDHTRLHLAKLRIMPKWVAGIVRALALFRTPSSQMRRSRVSCSSTRVPQVYATPRRSITARTRSQCQRRSWHCGSQLIHAGSVVPQAPQPADGELDHDVDVLVEGAPLSLDRCAASSSAARRCFVARLVCKRAVITPCRGATGI